MALDLRVHDTPEATIRAFCEAVVDAQPRSFVLTGGTTAGEAYRLLASEGWRERVPWGDATLLFGDERRVPPRSPDSCFHLVEHTLLQGVRPARVERLRGEAADPEAEAER